MKTLRYSVRPLVTFVAVLCLYASARADNLTTTVQQAAGASWSQNIWQPGAVVPAAGNTYQVIAGGNPSRIRNPTTGGIQTFPGDSLQLDAATEIRAKVTASALNFPGVGGNPGLILNGGNMDVGDNFAFTITGVILIQNASSFSCGDSGADNPSTRGWIIPAEIRGNTNIDVSRYYIGNANVNAIELTGVNNPFTGTWIFRSGNFKATGSGSLGNSNIRITPTNAVVNPAVFEVMYDVNSTGSLTLTNGGKMNLHQVCTWTAVTIEGTPLTVGTHPFAELSASFPNNFVAGGSGSITIAAPAPPPPPLNVTAVSGDTQVSLSWSPAVNAAGYFVNRSGASGGPYTNIGVTGTTNFVDSAVVNGSTYYYVLVSTNSLGASTNSLQVVGNPNVVVVGITAVGGTNQVVLNWSALAGAANYTVLRSGTSGGPFTNLATGLAGTTYTDTAVQGGNAYFYRIAAPLTGGGNSAQSATASGTTAPNAPVLSAVLFASTVLRLGWTPNNAVVSLFSVERSTDGVNFVPLATQAGNALSFTNSGLSLSNIYYYRVRATNAGGLSAYSNVSSNMTPVFGLNVNFGAGAANSANAGRISPLPPGYVNDIGDLFGNRTNGLFYGWTNAAGTNIVVDARWRQNAISPDLRYDDFIHLMKANLTDPSQSAIWQIQVPNGPYVVHIVCGESDNADVNADHFQFNVEGVVTSVYIPNATPPLAHWGDFVVNCAVSDGLLTINSGPSALNNKISFVDIYPDIPIRPIVGVQPQSQSSEEFHPVTLSVILSQGSETLSYQWYRNSSPVPGATSRTLDFPHIRAADAGNYFLIVTNYGGSATSSVATLAVTPDTTPPRIVSVGSLDGQSVGVCFTEQIDPSSGAALEAGNYQINGGSVVVDGVVIRSDGKSVKLHLFTPITGPFTLDVLDVPDYAGNSTISSTNSQVLGFAAQDVGGPALLGGNYTCDNTIFEIVGGGADIWANADQGYLATRTNSGNFDARVLVTDLRGSNAITKAVLTVREATNAESAALTISVNPPAPGRNQIEMGFRPAASNATVAVGTSFIPAGVPNAWMRVTRVGNVFTGYRSTNGVDWVQLGQTNVSLASTMQVGIGVTAHDNTLLATGTFTGFSVSQVLADVGIVGTGAPNPVTMGNNVTYSFTVTNNGSGAATGVKVIDVLPAGATFVSMNSSQGTRTSSGGTITFDLGTLAANAQATVTVVATATTAGPLNNTASVGTTALDTNTANNTVTVVTTVNAGVTQAPIGTVKFTGGTFSGAIQTQNGASYTVQFKNDLNLLPWNTLTNIIGDGTIKTFSDANPGVPKRFYRIVTP